MKLIAILAAAVLVAGCGTVGMNNMTPEQINASTKAKDANVVCVHAEGIWGKATTTFVNVDKGVVGSGGIAVSPDCQILFQNGVPTGRPL